MNLLMPTRKIESARREFQRCLSASRLREPGKQVLLSKMVDTSLAPDFCATCDGQGRNRQVTSLFTDSGFLQPTFCLKSQAQIGRGSGIHFWVLD
jgi:hypothetical protein